MGTRATCARTSTSETPPSLADIAHVCVWARCGAFCCQVQLGEIIGCVLGVLLCINLACIGSRFDVFSRSTLYGSPILVLKVVYNLSLSESRKAFPVLEYNGWVLVSRRDWAYALQWLIFVFFSS